MQFDERMKAVLNSPKGNVTFFAKKPVDFTLVQDRLVERFAFHNFLGRAAEIVSHQHRPASSICRRRWAAWFLPPGRKTEFSLPPRILVLYLQLVVNPEQKRSCFKFCQGTLVFLSWNYYSNVLVPTCTKGERFRFPSRLVYRENVSQRASVNESDVLSKGTVTSRN